MTYKKQSEKLLLLRKKYRAFTEQEKDTIKGVLTMNEMTILINSLRKIDEQVKIIHRPVGNYTQSLD
jgi:hypothetical protein